ncbi:MULTISPECIES: histidine phosphatase family protein [Rhodomicrobium]|uniref:histidine phosphatase family protein n=1 Tax=Rhodomicrobium TaxID=1068 RepID=UPI000B4C17CA|nr:MULTISPECIES: histidine phosphatase family protein [Rhodomicrobium]
MPTRLTLICHGATAATRDARFPRDEPLEPKEAARAAALAGGLRRADLVLTGPAQAARQTAAEFAPEAVVEAALRDCDYGDWSGRSIAEIHAEDPDGLAAWLTEPDAAPHGGESIEALCARISVWLDACRARGGHIVAITHNTVIRAALLAVLDAPLASFWRIDIEPLGLLDLRSDGTRWSLRASAAAARNP